MVVHRVEARMAAAHHIQVSNKVIHRVNIQTSAILVKLIYFRRLLAAF